MKNTKTHSKHIIIFIALMIALCLVCVSIFLHMQSSKMIDNAEDAIKRYMANKEQTYEIGMIQEIGKKMIAIVKYLPEDGEGALYLFTLEKSGKEVVVTDSMKTGLPMSMGVAVYKTIISNKTIVFGAVDDKVWLNLNGAPVQADFTQIKVLYSKDKEKSISINNFQTFMFCIDEEVYVNDVIFLSGNNVVAKLSELPIAADVIENFNNPEKP